MRWGRGLDELDRRSVARPTGGGLVLLVDADSVQVGDDLDPGRQSRPGPRRVVVGVQADAVVACQPKWRPTAGRRERTARRADTAKTRRAGQERSPSLFGQVRATVAPRLCSGVRTRRPNEADPPASYRRFCTGCAEVKLQGLPRRAPRPDFKRGSEQLRRS